MASPTLKTMHGASVSGQCRGAGRQDTPVHAGEGGNRWRRSGTPRGHCGRGAAGQERDGSSVPVTQTDGTAPCREGGVSRPRSLPAASARERLGL